MIIGKKILRFKTLDSTNDEARRQISAGAGEGIGIVTESQTKGRGKPGSSWQSPKGNLYFSAVVKPYKNPKDLSPITLIGALAARTLIIKLSKLPVVIKWPNDLLVHGKKIAGILTERLPSGHIIIGIGININVVPDKMKGTATSLKAEKKKNFDLKKGEKILIDELNREYLHLLLPGKFANI
ncbi:MAG: biotin--[acetyl-CoA-carboxylase] ligase [bacterium]